MKISISIARPQTSSSGPKCLGEGRSRSTATSEATNTISSTEPAGPRSSTRIASSARTAGTRVEEQLPLEGQRPQPRAHEDVAGLAQVAREEDDDPELRELGRLELDRAELDREEGAVDLRADARQARQHEQGDAAGRDQVAVALQHVVVADQQDRGAEEDEPDHEPLRLLARQLRVDPVDQHEPDRRQQGGEREQVRVGVGQARADEQVRDDAQAEEDGAVGERGVLHVLRCAWRARRRSRPPRAATPGSARTALASVPTSVRRRPGALELAALERAHEVDGVLAAAPLVVEHALAAPRRDRPGRHPARVLLRRRGRSPKGSS